MTDRSDWESYTYRINVTVYAASGEEADQVIADWIRSSPHPTTSFPECMGSGDD